MARTSEGLFPIYGDEGDKAIPVKRAGPRYLDMELCTTAPWSSPTRSWLVLGGPRFKRRRRKEEVRLKAHVGTAKHVAAL